MLYALAVVCHFVYGTDSALHIRTADPVRIYFLGQTSYNQDASSYICIYFDKRKNAIHLPITSFAKFQDTSPQKSVGSSCRES